MTEVVFPALSKENEHASGVVATWYVADGEPVVVGQVLADVQLDKVDVEVPAPVAGTVRLAVAEGEEVVQGVTIATID